MTSNLVNALLRSIAIGIISFIVTFFLAQQVNQQLQKESYLKLENIAKQVSIHLQAAIDKSTNDLQALQAFYSALPKENSLQDFNHYMQVFDVESRNHTEALGWVPLIKEEQRDNFLAKMRKQYPNYNIKALNDDGTINISGKKPSYTPVAYVSTYEKNKTAQGFDVSSNLTRRTSLEYARDTGNMTTTSKIKLVVENENSYGFLVIAPVYDLQQAINTVPEKRAALLGYVTGVFRINILMEIAKQQADSEGLLITLVDKDEKNGDLLYGEIQNDAFFSFNQEIPNRHWQLDISPNVALQKKNRFA